MKILATVLGMMLIGLGSLGCVLILVDLRHGEATGGAIACFAIVYGGAAILRYSSLSRASTANHNSEQAHG